MTDDSESQTSIVTAGIVVIGDEILSGRTKDKNIGHIAEKLTDAGIQLREVRIVADDEDAIVEAVNTLRARYDYVFTTGGIGPTHDDITADSIGKAFGLRVDQDPRAVEILQRHFRESELTPARLRMTRMPEGAELIANPVSAAPGFRVGNVYVMAGVPRIMEGMLDNILPGLRTGTRVLSRTVRVDGKEGDIADILGQAQDNFPGVAVGSYPFHVDNRFGVNVVVRATDTEMLDSVQTWLMERLSGRGVAADVPDEDYLA
jgi:molybdenum cofactor synthesis domain-containing protein